MLLSAVSVLVVAQSISEIPEGLMNNSVYAMPYTSQLSKTVQYSVIQNNTKPILVSKWRDEISFTASYLLD